ncbi:MAG: hypothetical protein DMF64_21800 [Acidobacteria bacterium]|nr:MAG: hypothetical protein DMF64_21800 [Acidobacteriota bacterium]
MQGQTGVAINPTVATPLSWALLLSCPDSRPDRKLADTVKRVEWTARTKRELMIEVWEHLDCETVGASELEEIIAAVRERFGAGAVESPAQVARLLADEGAELRHAEVLEADARWRARDPYEAMFRNVLRFADFAQAAASLKRLENLRREFARKKDQEGLRRVREVALKGKRRAQMIARNTAVNEEKRAEKTEIAEWFTVWLQTPELFQDWLVLRCRSADFRARFAAANERVQE